MQIEQQKVDGLTYTFTVKVPANKVQERFEEKLQAFGKTRRIPGFRPGKVPVAVLENRFGGQVITEAVGDVVNEACSQVLEQNKLKQAKRPEVDIKDYNKGEDLSFDLTIECLPKFELGDPAKTALTQYVVDISDKEVDEHIAKLASSTTRFVDLGKARPAQKGDLVRCSVDISIDGKPSQEHHLSDVPFELGNTAPALSAITSKLEGVKTGDKITVEEPFSAEFKDKKLKSGKVMGDVTILSVQEPKAYEVNDEFAERFNCKTIQRLQTKIKEDLETQNLQYARIVMKRKLLDHLAESYKFDLPATMVKTEFDTIWKRLQSELESARKAGRLEEEDNDTNEEELRKEYQQIAERRVRLGLVISEIGTAHNISLNDSEVRNAIIREAQRYRGQEQQVADYYMKNQNALRSLLSPALEDKVVDYLISKAKLEEKKVPQKELKNIVREIIPSLFMNEEDEEEEKSSSKASSKKEAKKS